MRTTRQRSIVLAVALVIATATACGSSSKSASDTGTTVGTSATCPFSGSTQAQRQTGLTSQTQLTNVQTGTAGCIDNVQFKFNPTLATSETAYQSATAGTSGAVLVVTLKTTTLASK